MNREIRKANLKKLQIPGTGNLRKTRSATNPVISNFFPSVANDETDILPENPSKTITNEVLPSSSTECLNLLANSHFSKTNPLEDESKSKLASTIKDPKCFKRTKLNSFISKDKKTINGGSGKEPSTDDFETPKKKTKRIAPIAKPRRPKRQAKLKGTFFKNEQLFSEITAQHCIADNFNPDEIQLALAMSRSEAETIANCNDMDQDSVRRKLQTYGFRTGDKDAYNNITSTLLPGYARKNKKNKWANKFTALTLRQPELQVAKVNQKVAEFLEKQVLATSKQTDGLKSYQILSETLRRCQSNDPIIKKADNFSTKDQLEMFYVQELFAVSRVPAGHLLKNWSLIQGRDLSPPVRGDKADKGALSKMHSKVFAELNEYFDRIDGKNQLQNELPEQRELVEVVHKISANASNNKPNKEDKQVVVPFDLFSKEEADKDSKESIHVSVTDLSKPALIADKEPSPTLLSQNSNEIVTIANISKLLEPVNKIENEIFNGLAQNDLYKSPVNKKSKPSNVLIAIDVAKANYLQPQKELTQPTSPDIFADSDSDVEMNEEVSKVSANFSGDHYDIARDKNSFNAEGPNSSLNVGIIDLTQEEDHDDERVLHLSSNPCELNFSTEHLVSPFVFDELNDGNNQFVITEKSEDSIGFQLKSPFKDPSPTQSGVNESDDDCILLSDDEVNYSIWKASKPAKADSDADDLGIGTDNSNQISSDDSKTGCNNQTELHEFSLLDLIDERSCQSPISSELVIDFDTALNQITSDYPATQTQHTTSLTQSPVKAKTPRKCIPSAKKNCLKVLSESSFLRSPSKKTALSQCYRPSASQKFETVEKKNETNCIDDTDAMGSFSDFDEIDKLVFGSPTKKQLKMPAGLDQLLTGEISFVQETKQLRVVSLSPSPPRISSLSQQQLAGPTPPMSASLSLEISKEFQFKGKTYMVRTVGLSQKPNFETMDEALLLKQLYEFGIKPLKRKLAIQMLEYIYNQTHPYFAEEEVLGTQNVEAVSVSSEQNFETVSVVSSESKSCQSKFNLQDCYGDVLIQIWDDLSAEMPSEQYILQTNVTKRTLQPLLPFHIAWFNLVRSNTALHEAILLYEPIDLQEIYLFFKRLGFRYDPKDMKSFFDSRCIIFRYDITAPGKQSGSNRHVRKKVSAKIKR